MIKDFLTRIDFQKNGNIILGGIGLVIILFAVFSFLSTPVKNTARKDMILTIPAMGNLPALDMKMKQSSTLRGKVKELLSYDESYLFVNYSQVNDLVIDIMFLWIGLTPEEIEQKGRQKSAEYFIRRVYNLPKDEPIKNNPLLEKYPWASLFQKIKAKLLMQGQGHKIYDGVAYYDNEKDKMVVEGTLSQNFAISLSDFIKTQPKDKQKSYINNYLMFVDETLGLKNLSDKEKKFLKNSGFL